jgi:hypothetical protein
LTFEIFVCLAVAVVIFAVANLDKIVSQTVAVVIKTVRRAGFGRRLFFKITFRPIGFTRFVLFANLQTAALPRLSAESTGPRRETSLAIFVCGSVAVIVLVIAELCGSSVPHCLCLYLAVNVGALAADSARFTERRTIPPGVRLGIAVLQAFAGPAAARPTDISSALCLSTSREKQSTN